MAWSAIAARWPAARGPRFEQYQAVAASIVIVAGVSGLVLYLSGARPADGLHLLYGLIAVALIPLARSFLGETRARGAAVLLLVAFVVLGAVTYRLFATG